MSMPVTYLDNAGAQWVLGAAGVDRYPTDGIGTGTATASASLLVAAKAVTLDGIFVTTAGTTVEVIVHDGAAATVLAGHSFSSVAVGAIQFPSHRVIALTASGAGNCNVGIRCNGTTVATLFYRKLA